jgi:hypothetical protein
LTYWSILFVPILLIIPQVANAQQLTTTTGNTSIIGYATAYCESLNNNATAQNATSLKQCITNYISEYNSLVANQHRIANSMPKYTDPQGRFSINYPGNWTVISATNRFQFIRLSFSNCCQQNGMPYSFFNLAIENGMATDPAVVANMYSTKYIPFGGSVFQNVECTKYHIEGQKACSIILTITNPISQVAGATEEVFSYVHGMMFVFYMGANQDNFDSYLPTFQKMMASFRSPPG